MLLSDTRAGTDSEKQPDIQADIRPARYQVHSYIHTDDTDLKGQQKSTKKN